MRIVITGGTGLIGSALGSALVQAGHEVWALSRNPATARTPAGVRLESWDGVSSQGWAYLLEETDVVVNLAGENIGSLPWTQARKDLIRASRVRAGRAVTRAIIETGARPVVLQSSAVGYYGVKSVNALDETAPSGDDYLSGVSRDWENATAELEGLDIRRVILRIGVALDAREGILPRFLTPFRMGVGGVMGSGAQVISWIHLADVIGAMQFLIERSDLSGAFNLTAPGALSNAEFGRVLAAKLNRPFWAPAPAFALRAALGEMSTLVLDGQRVEPKRLLEAGFQFRFPTLQQALEDLLK